MATSMQPLFGEEGIRRLLSFIKPCVLCAFDFDGTLAPIVERPQQAVLPDDIRDRLVCLAEHATVAVVTGRSVADIGQRLGFRPAYVVGNHGLEGIPGDESRLDDYRRICQAWLRQLHVFAHEPGIEIEDKTYSLSLHYRLASDPSRVAERLRNALMLLEPMPRVIDGKCVFNLLPTGGVGKGHAVERLIEASSAPGAIYVGDDVTDEDVFRLRRPDILSIRVEHAAGSAAEFFIDDCRDVVRLLDRMIEGFDTLHRSSSDHAHVFHS